MRMYEAKSKGYAAFLKKSLAKDFKQTTNTATNLRKAKANT